MVLALANALKLTIIIITSILNQPIIRIDLRNVAVAVPLFLTFCQYGAGHYNAVILKSTKTDKTNTMCRCGNNDKKTPTNIGVLQSGLKSTYLAALVLVPTKHVVSVKNVEILMVCTKIQ